MLPQLSLFQQCSIQSQDVMQTWLLGDAKMLNLFKNISWLSFTQSLMTVCILIWRVVLMCTYAVVTHPCDIPPLAQARPMMLCIYTSIKYSQGIGYLACCCTLTSTADFCFLGKAPSQLFYSSFQGRF